MRYPNGSYFTGEFKDNLKDGYGEDIRVDGNFFKGIYKKLIILLLLLSLLLSLLSLLLLLLLEIKSIKEHLLNVKMMDLLILTQVTSIMKYFMVKAV